MASNGRRDLVHGDAGQPPLRQRASAPPRARKDKKQSETGRSFTAVDSPLDDKPSDLEALRKARLNHISTLAEGQRKKMKYIGETITREPARKADVEYVRKVSGAKRRRKRTDAEGKPRRRKIRVEEADAGEYQSVYQRHDRQGNVEPRRTNVDGEDTEGLDNSGVQSENPSDPTPQKTKRSKISNTVHLVDVVVKRQ